MKATLLYGLLLLSWPCFAQKETVPLHYTLKTSPLNYLNPYQRSIDIIGDIPFASRWALEAGVSIVVHSESFARFEGESYTGVKIRPTIKYYYKKSPRTHTYIALALKYNHINNKQYETVARQGRQYTETMLINQRLVTWGAAFRSGFQYYMGRRRRCVLDYSVALGFRQRNISEKMVPPDGEVLDDGRFSFINRNAGQYFVGDFMVSLSLGWVIAKRKDDAKQVQDGM